MRIPSIRAIVISFFAVCFTPVLGQDLLVERAPINKKLETVDSVALQQIYSRERYRNVSELYPTWNNSYVHSYSVQPPDTFQIDLRGFTMPTTSRRITSRYGYRRRFHRMHYGLDIKVYIGDTIRAAFGGKVRVVKYDYRGYGRYIILRHPNGLETTYAHLSKQLVKENDVVASGQVIGLGGNTGRSTGSHLHFETRLLGKPINPEVMFDFPHQDVTKDYYVYHSSKSKNKYYASSNSRSSGTRFYKVRKGDCLSIISKKLGISSSTLRRVNGLSSKSVLQIGQVIRY